MEIGTMARVLVIDDDAQTRRMVCEVLGRAGHATIEAADGRVGLARFRECPADVIVTDIFMPEQDGLEVILEFRREFPRVGVIAISGGGGQSPMDYLPFARALGAARTLAKPFTPSELLDAVRATLEDSGPPSGSEPASR